MHIVHTATEVVYNIHVDHVQPNRPSSFTAFAQEQERLGPKPELAGLSRQEPVRLVVKIGKWKEWYSNAALTSAPGMVRTDGEQPCRGTSLNLWF